MRVKAFACLAAFAALFVAVVVRGGILFHIQEPPWSFIQIEDLHAGSIYNPGPFSNTIDTIIGSNAAWNLKFVLSAGDLFESTTNSVGLTEIIDMTNQMWRCKRAGIPWVNIPGNHDADTTTFPPDYTNILYWNQIFGDSFYANDVGVYKFTNRLSGSTRDCAWKLTNGSTKFLIVGMAWNENQSACEGYGYESPSNVVYAYTPVTTWASNLARQFPDHHLIAAMHYFVDTNGTPSTQDLPQSDWHCGHNATSGYVNEGPGIAAWLSLKSLPNITLYLSGHVRARPMTKSTLVADDGHTVESVKFNTQSVNLTNLVNCGAFVLYTVYPSEHYIRARVFSTWPDFPGRFLTNGEFAEPQGFVNDWTFPIREL